MRIPRLDLNIQRAEIGINTTRAELDITHERANIEVNDQKTQVQIDRRAPSFTADWQRVWSEIGIESSTAFAMRFRDKGRQAAFRGIARYSQEGDHLANHRIPVRERTSSMARSAANSRLSRAEVNVGLSPQSPPNLTWDTGGVSVSWIPHSLTVNSDTIYHMPQTNLNPRQSVSTYLRTQPHISVSVVDTRI